MTSSTSATTDNIGETGLQSIRIRGLRIDELPIAEKHVAQEQLRLAEDDDRQEKIKLVMETHPPYQVSALKAQVTSCRASIARAQAVIDQENQRIEEYAVHVAMCERRDVALKDLGVALEKL